MAPASVATSASVAGTEAGATQFAQVGPASVPTSETTTASNAAPSADSDSAVAEADRLEAAGNIDGALQKLHDAALIADPARRAELYVRAARALARKQRWEEALAEGYAGIAADPRSGWTYLEVAKILAQAGRRAAAVEMAQEAASRDAQVRFAAQDFIGEIRRAGPDQSPPPAPGPGGFPWSWLLVGITAVLAVFGAIGYLVSRDPRPVPADELTQLVPAADSATDLPDPVEATEGVPDTMPLVTGRALGPGDFIGPYRVDRVVATSLHSTLYRAEDLRLRRQVAIKQANPVGMQSEAALLRFQKEVQSLIALSTYHDGVIKVYDYLPPGTLVTEWVEGQNLDELVGELPIDRVIQIGIDLCDILAFAHSMAIVHRDIKPSNVMVSSQSHRVKLLDFGIAKNAGLGISQVTTDSDVPIGTFTYMAPEQFASPNQAHGASDIYSLGLTLYRIITGALPAAPWLGPRTFSLVPPDAFQAIDEFAPAVQIFLGTIGDLLPDLDWIEDLDRVISKSFRENAADRYRSAAELKAELERVRALISASVRT
jgi:tetratricopeptide (TPR) repeat protein